MSDVPPTYPTLRGLWSTEGALLLPNPVVPGGLCSDRSLLHQSRRPRSGPTPAVPPRASDPSTGFSIGVRGLCDWLPSRLADLCPRDWGQRIWWNTEAHDFLPSFSFTRVSKSNKEGRGRKFQPHSTPVVFTLTRETFPP